MTPPPVPAPASPRNPDDAATLAGRVTALEYRYAGVGGASLVAAMVNCEFRGSIALVSSFGASSAVLLHMVAGIDRRLPVLFLDTGKLFGETLRYREQLVRRLDLSDVRDIRPDSSRIAAHDPDGALWARDENLCCFLRKVEPLSRALAPFAAWITGRRREQGDLRAGLPLVEADQGRTKINPLAGWTQRDINDYFATHELPRHPLEADGFLSIGCMPCTDRVANGENTRAGRWRGRGKTECGIHLTCRRKLSTEVVQSG